MDATTLRETIPALESTIYCNWGASGPSPRSVVEAAERTLTAHEYDAPSGSGQYSAAFDVYDETRAAVADLLNATPNEIALTESTTDGINRIAGALEWAEDDVVVRTDLEHSAGVLPWKRLERTRGIDIRVLETTDGRVDLEDVTELASEATLFCVSSLTWTHGTRLPVAEIVEIAHDNDALVLVDAVQSVGQGPVDVQRWDADFVVGAGHKWLLAPFGSGFLYVRDDVASRLEPPAIGYRSVENPDEHGADYRYHPGARRFEVSTSSPVPYAGLSAGIGQLTEVDLETVQDRIDRLTDRLAAGIPDERLVGPVEPESGLVPIAVSEPEATVERLAEQDIVVRSLPDPDAIRASIHAVNTRTDVDQLLEALSL
ncbi:aminotransferase class V-fold PLP-dependent enzyme [Natronolimnobius baerhuensis]|uniref:Cysteine desulfurase n=1 Tax=Natronolimnobius baerhuensis TaxID=253108 RepID=A0A202EAL0_9EURY|nr:aminotransferase class V-fold PLP-dependent enzyme [Natronolimnobius baerhuensis]OVE85313.1 cysteine desulfurase [Natronolimnobius baerhuensis]